MGKEETKAYDGTQKCQDRGGAFAERRQLMQPWFTFALKCNYNEEVCRPYSDSPMDMHAARTLGGQC